jgi:hypothetical protein
MESLFQAIVYYRIERRSFDATKTFVHRVFLSTGVRKATWLVTIRTAIGAMILLVIIIIGSLSKRMWISLTPVGITRPN